jgi:zinc transport system substrate-binding protein
MKKTIILTAILTVIGLFLAGCSSRNESMETDGKVTVYTTVYPLQYFTQKMAGDFVAVESIYPPGADEHTFEPSQRDMMNIADADVFFYIGLGLEGFVEKAKSTLKNEGVKFIPLGESVDLEPLAHNEEHSSEEHQHEEEHNEEHSNEEHEHEEEHNEEHSNEEHEHEEGHNHDHGDIDPHIWIDPILAKEIALAIKNELILQLPENATVIEENYESLIHELDVLHSEYVDTFTSAKHKEAIVSHSAYGYWEKRYGFKQLSISGLSSASEPSQKQLEELVKTAKVKQLHYILFEQNVNSKLGEIIQKELGAKPLALHNLASLTDSDIENEEDYFTLMRKNLAALQIALND